jgi:thiol:disulfide interchange protein DsbD
MGITEQLYEGTLLFRISIVSGTSDVPIHMKATLKYQGCNDKVCLPPTESHAEITIPVSTSQADNKVTISDKFTKSSLAATLIFLFLSGIALCLTPCVYPIIPVTLGFFASQSSGSRKKTVLLAALYAFGITLTYSFLGTIAAVSGSILGSALQHPSVVIGIAAVFIALALSMFGLYEFRLPSSLNQLAVGRSGHAGALIMGLIVGIVAAPCVGPVTAALLVHVAEKQDPLIGFIYFFALASGLGIPFFILGLFSGSLKKLPTSGSWLNSVKKMFGFVLSGMAVYYLIPLLGEQTALLIISLLAFIASIYFIFVNKDSGKGNTHKTIIKLIGLALAFASIWSGITTIRQGSQTDKNDDTAQVDKHMAFSEEAFTSAVQAGKPFVVDFRADWCAPCRAFEKDVLSDAEVRRILETTPFYSADLTNNSNPASRNMINKFRITGVPTLLFFNKNGIETGRFTGYMEKKLFLEAVNSLNNTGGTDK